MSAGLLHPLHPAVPVGSKDEPDALFHTWQSCGQGEPSLALGCCCRWAGPDGWEGRKFPCRISALPQAAPLSSQPRQIQQLPPLWLFSYHQAANYFCSTEMKPIPRSYYKGGCDQRQQRTLLVGRAIGSLHDPGMA